MRAPRPGQSALAGTLLLTALLLPACAGRDDRGSSPPPPAATTPARAVDAAAAAAVQDSVTRAEALLDGLDADLQGDSALEGNDTDG